MGRTDAPATESNEVQETAAAVARVKDSSNSQRAQNGRHGCGGNVTEVQEKISEDNAAPYSNVEKLMPGFTQGGDYEPNLNNESTVVNTTSSVLGHLESKPNKPKATWTRLNRMEVGPPISASSVIKPTLGKRNMGDTLDKDYNIETEYTSLKRSKVEMWALRDDLNMCLNMQISALEIDLDAKVVADLMCNAKILNTDNAFIVAVCRPLISQFSQVKVSHCYREANRCANALTRLGCSQVPDFMYLNSPPACILNVFLFDLNGLTQIRLCPLPDVFASY
nr:hypothetical protein CFP56_75700 [Quercus suber]